jgi:hypothetical protein
MRPPGGGRENGISGNSGRLAGAPSRRHGAACGTRTGFPGGMIGNGWMVLAFLSPRFIYCVDEVVVMVM